MPKVASTDQKGHLIILAGKAIDITGEGQRDAETLQALIDHLQAYKEGKPYPPPSAQALSCCGYPHHDGPRRSNYGPTQVRYLCQLYQGLIVQWNNTQRGGIARWIITSIPYQREGRWWIKREDHELGMIGVERKTPLDEYSIVGGPGTLYPKWDRYDWLSFVGKPIPHHSYHQPFCNH